MGRMASPASPAIRKPIAVNCPPVFHLASRDTGTLTRTLREFPQARNKDSRHRITIAASSDNQELCRGGQHQQRGGDQQLVGDRIEHPASEGLLRPEARKIAVQQIGDRGRD